jgi:Ca2+-binding RTX toxin-like protein
MASIDVARTANGYHLTYGSSSVDYVVHGANPVVEIGWAYRNGLFGLDIQADTANGQFIPTWTIDNDLTGNVSRSILVGTSGNDTITSFGNTNMMFGGDGNDTLTGGSNVATDATAGKNDIYVGGKGNDTLIDLGHSANAYVFAVGDGVDTINDYGSTAFNGYADGDRIVIGAPGTVLQTLGAVHDNAGPNPLNLTIQYSDTDQITILDQYAGNGHNIEFINFNGSSYRGYDFGLQDYLINTQATGPDDLPFNAPATFSVGNKGVDNILGSAWSAGEPLASGAGGILIGADQSDTLYAGYGSDLLIGGAGSDNFKFTSRGFSNRGDIDVIADFVDGTDKIDLRGVNIGWAAEDQISFASLTTTYDAAKNITTLTQVGHDPFADDPAGFAVKLYGQHTLLATDFIFV